MKQVMVRYKVKPDRVQENEALVRAVYEELQEVSPPGFRYVTYKLDDGVTFVHLAVTEADAEGDGRVLPKLRAFQAFRKDLADRTEEGPASTELEQIGAFRLAGDATAMTS
jgi:hypothetical protein